MSVELESQLGTCGTDYYRKSLICRNSGYGLAALAYQRRVVEDAMHALLDLVIEAAKASNRPIDLSAIKEEKANRRFDDKAEFASKILPAHLKPGGHNPFDILHGAFSEGVHSMTEDDCIVQFDKTRTAFEYLFKNLSISTEEAKNFLQTLGELSRKRIKEEPRKV